MSFSFPPIYQNHIDLWSPFTKLERLPQVETKKVEQVSDNVQVLTLMIGGDNLRSIVMSNILDLNEFRKKKEQEAEKAQATELYQLLSELMLDDEPVIITITDSDGNETEIDIDEIMRLSDSNHSLF